MAHAELGASGAYRWTACPGSVHLSRGLPSTSSIFSQTGTVAHSLAEYRLSEHLAGRAVPDLLGQAVDPDHPEIVVDEEMREAVQVYERHCLDLLDQVQPDGLFLIEERVSLAPMGGIGKDMFGTADLIAFDPERQTVYVRDYKHGSGVPVEIEANPQLRYYGLGAALRIWDKLGRSAPVRYVDYGIVQPRCHHPDGPIRTEVIDMVALLEWGEELLDAAERTQDEDAPVTPGGHCRFCPALSVCPAVREQKLAQAKLLFTEEGKVEPETPLEALSPDELKVIVDNAEDIVAWVKAAQQMAQTRLENGLPMPGYKLVAKRASRSWIDEQAALEAICERFYTDPDDLFRRTFLSPAQVEKALRLDKEGKALINTLTESISSGTTLAPENDKRPAVDGRTRPSAQDVFEELD